MENPTILIIGGSSQKMLGLSGIKDSYHLNNDGSTASSHSQTPSYPRLSSRSRQASLVASFLSSRRPDRSARHAISVLRRHNIRDRICDILRLTDLRNAGRAAHVAGSGRTCGPRRLRTQPPNGPSPALPRAGSANSFFRLAPAWAGVSESGRLPETDYELLLSK